MSVYIEMINFYLETSKLYGPYETYEEARENKTKFDAIIDHERVFCDIVDEEGE